MSAEEIKVYERKWFDVLNKGKAAVMTAIDEYFTSTFVFHSPLGTNLNFEGLKKFFSGLYDAFPDQQYTLDDVIVEGDKAVVRWTFTGTHKGAFMGIPPTNKKVAFWEIEIHRLAGGKQAEAWARLDTLGLMQQLGVIPTPKR